MCSLEKRGNIFILTLTGPTDHRLSPSVISSLRQNLALVRSEASSSNVLVTCADGNFFSNGFDVAYASAAATSPERAARLQSMVATFVPLVADLYSLPMPTIAAVTGHAAAAGFILALSHDYIIMRGDRGVIYMSEMDMKLPFPPYFIEIMRTKIKDLGLLKDIVMKGRKVKAAEAFEKGVVDEVKGTREEVISAALEMAEGFLKRKWDMKVYASIRMGVFEGICTAVGLEKESQVDRDKLVVSKL